MSLLYEDYSSHDYNFNSASELVSNDRREGRSNSSASRIFSTTIYLRIEKVSLLIIIIMTYLI